jgi:hypothetical protein
MAITQQQILDAPKYNVIYIKTGAGSSNLGVLYNQISMTGTPSSVITPTNNTTGIVPIAGQTGYPTVSKIQGTGYLTRVNYEALFDSAVIIFDRVFAAGTFTFGTLYNLSGQPSYASRAPNGSYVGFEILVEPVTTFTGISTFTYSYINQDGVTRNMVMNTSSALGVNLSRKLELFQGDTGVQQFLSIQESGASAGTYVISIVRNLCSLAYVKGGEKTKVASFVATGCPIVFQDTAFYVFTKSTGNPTLKHVIMEISDV